MHDVSKMNNLTFLSLDQVIGENQLEIFKKYGTKAIITDFSILLGGYVNNNYILKKLKYRTSCYYLKNANHGFVMYIDEKGSTQEDYPNDNFIGAVQFYAIHQLKVMF